MKKKLSILFLFFFVGASIALSRDECWTVLECGAGDIDCGYSGNKPSCNGNLMVEVS
jgi:hypothetical protein